MGIIEYQKQIFKSSPRGVRLTIFEKI